MCEHSTSSSLKMEDGKLKMKLNWMRKFDCGRCMLNVEVGHKKKIWRSLWKKCYSFPVFYCRISCELFFLYVTIFRQTLTLKLLFFPRLLSDNVWDKLEDLRTDIHGHIHSWTPPKKKHKQDEESHATFTENEIYWLYPVVIAPSLPSLVTFLYHFSWFLLFKEVIGGMR